MTRTWIFVTARARALGLLCAFAAALAPAAVFAAGPPREGGLLVAHRGGVVDKARPENSLAALDEAIRRGYTHVEVDLRATKDGQVVCLHDRSLKRTTGLDLNVDDLTLAELHAKVDPARVPTLAAYAARAAGRIQLMPDVKEVPPELKDALTDGVRRTLEAHGLMAGALFIGWNEVIDGYAGAARVAWRKPLAEFRQTVAGRPGAAAGYFAFDHAKDFDKAEVEGFQALGVPVVITVNTLHYLGGDPMRQGEADIAAAVAMGVDGLQIDSVYARFAPPQYGARRRP